MAHFYASIQGNRSERTCMGTAKSGIYGHVRGWNIGGKVLVNDYDGQDMVDIYITHGSNGGGLQEFLGRYSIDKDGTSIVKIS